MPVLPDSSPSQKSWWHLIFYGICMGIADIIPGISGGTIAFIMGFYEDLVNSIKSLNVLAIRKFLCGHFNEFFKLISWKFLIGLLSGIIIAMASLAHLVSFILNHEYYRIFLYATFFGLILAASWLCLLQIKKRTLTCFIIFLSTIPIAFFFTGSIFDKTPSHDLYNVKIESAFLEKPLDNYDSSTQMLQVVSGSTLSAMLAKHIIKPTTLVYNYEKEIYGTAETFIQPKAETNFDGWIILCGALAVCAMILPGISGSYLLTVLGMYATAVGALADFSNSLIHLQFNKEAFFILTNLLIGILIGAVTFTRFISWILSRYHDFAIAALTGFMVGALRSVWPFWDYHFILLPLNPDKGPQLQVINPIIPNIASLDTWIAISLACSGAIAVFALHYVAQNTNQTSVTEKTQR